MANYVRDPFNEAGSRPEEEPEVVYSSKYHVYAKQFTYLYWTWGIFHLYMVIVCKLIFSWYPGLI